MIKHYCDECKHEIKPNEAGELVVTAKIAEDIGYKHKSFQGEFCSQICLIVYLKTWGNFDHRNPKR